MMIAMMIMLLCVRVSLLMTTNATFLFSHQIQAFHELGYDQKVLSYGLSRKLMLNKMGEGYGDQDLVLYNDQKKALLAGNLLITLSFRNNSAMSQSIILKK
ncbi:hypothetical protein HanHA300_Chr08g0269091 [Helianthus annuus]|nr:hypothetical protein HanHA300_Chr08g0269091 [Helianthus annuus]KAJ0545616.1 hypothetical protein HanIR_Chr08g0351781 [Helianthus annuus]KAJ0718196.1 hypothetical protein HanLR1_Chr08g0267971 [Helianthus annuus]